VGSHRCSMNCLRAPSKEAARPDKAHMPLHSAGPSVRGWMRLRACNPPRQRALAAAEALVRLATLPLLAPAFTHRPRYDRSPTCCCVADLRRSAAALFALQCGQRCKFLPPVCTHPISSSPLISKLQVGICAIKRLLQLISISPSQMLLPVQRDYCFGCRVLSVILLALTEGDEGGTLKYRPDCKPHHEGDASRRRHVRSALSDHGDHPLIS
jgi:hypothetical protein